MDNKKTEVKKTEVTTEKTITETQFKQHSRSNRGVKILNTEAISLIKVIEDRNKNKIVELDKEQTNTILKGYLGHPQPQNYNSSLCYAIARTINNINPLLYKKVAVGKDKVLIEDISRVAFKNDLIAMDFTVRN